MTCFNKNILTWSRFFLSICGHACNEQTQWSCCFFKCSLDSIIFHALHVLCFLLLPPTWEKLNLLVEYRSKSFLCVQLIPRTVAGVLWRISWVSPFPCACLLHSSLPGCMHLFCWAASHWTCVCVCCFLKGFCSHHHTLQMHLIRFGDSSTGFTHAGCVPMDAPSTGELGSKKAQLGPCRVT